MIGRLRFVDETGGVVHGHPRAMSIARSLTTCLAIALVTLVAVGCVQTDGTPPGVTPMPERSISEVLAAHTPDLMSIDGVVGVYEGLTDDGKPCIKVMVAARSPELERAVPSELEGYPVVIEETGEIRAMPDTAG